MNKLEDICDLRKLLEVAFGLTYHVESVLRELKRDIEVLHQLLELMRVHL